MIYSYESISVYRQQYSNQNIDLKLIIELRRQGSQFHRMVRFEKILNCYAFFYFVNLFVKLSSSTPQR